MSAHHPCNGHGLHARIIVLAALKPFQPDTSFRMDRGPFLFFSIIMLIYRYPNNDLSAFQPLAIYIYVPFMQHGQAFYKGQPDARAQVRIRYPVISLEKMLYGFL